MQYLGGKKRIAKQLAEFLNSKLNGYKYYLEPFVGSAAVIEKVNHKIRIGCDKNEYLIQLFLALQNGWIPPKELSEEQYNYIKEHKDEDKVLTAFAGFGCSFSGKWFGGYCRDKKTERNYALNAHNTLLAQLPLIKTVYFKQADYRTLNPKNALIYCDPPYCSTTKYDALPAFDSGLFWEKMIEWSKVNLVYISEYVAPEDFECVLEIETRTDLKNSSGKMIPRVEKLFTYKR